MLYKNDIIVNYNVKLKKMLIYKFKDVMIKESKEIYYHDKF